MKGKAEVADLSRERQSDGLVQERSRSWGVLRSGLWGVLESEKEGAPCENQSEQDYREASFDFPLELLDVDESIPKFDSVVDDEEKEADDEAWGDEAGFYSSSF